MFHSLCMSCGCLPGREHFWSTTCGVLIDDVCVFAAQSGHSDVERCRGASVALGCLRPHCGSTTRPHHRLLLHRKGNTHGHGHTRTRTHSHRDRHTHTQTCVSWINGSLREIQWWGLRTHQESFIRKESWMSPWHELSCSLLRELMSQCVWLSTEVFRISSGSVESQHLTGRLKGSQTPVHHLLRPGDWRCC